MSAEGLENERKLTEEERLLGLEANVREGLAEIDELLPFIKHGEAKRMFTAIMRHPLIEEDFADESIEMRRAYSAAKRVKEWMIATTAELFIKNLTEAQEEVNNG